METGGRVFTPRRPRRLLALAAAMVVVASLGAVAGPAGARPERFHGAAPGSVTCQLSGTVSFNPRLSASQSTAHPSRLTGRLSGCRTSNAAVTITSGRVTETFKASPLNCATLSSTGAPASLTVAWKGNAFGHRASFTKTRETNNASQVVTNGRGFEGFAVPGAGGRSSTSGSFAAASGSTSNAYTTLTHGALDSMCRSAKGVAKLTVAGTITLGSGVAQGGKYAVALGAYAGYANPDGLVSFELATGAHLTYATDYLAKGQGWAAMAEAPGASAWSHSGFRLVMAVPILPGVGTLAQGATGAYNQYFTTLAKNLVSAGEANAILRLGWEFNGNWYRWSVQSSADAANFVKYWQHIVTTMRAVHGQSFKFSWNPNGPSPTSYSPDQAYPGNAYVDYVGTDQYDNFWGSPFTPSAAWANDLSQQWGLNWLASFAVAHAKPIGIPEWSDEYRPDGHGLGDDPSFMDAMAAWFVSHKVAFADIWSYDSSSTYRNNILDGTFPKSLAEFKVDFG
ncbi:MAG TPA: glycosyl hydrolase [Acidimicrobiales bacterium]